MIKYRILGDQKKGLISIGGQDWRMELEYYKGTPTGVIRVPESQRSIIESSSLFLIGNVIEWTVAEKKQNEITYAVEYFFEGTPFSSAEYQSFKDLPDEAKELIRENAFLIRDRFLQSDTTEVVESPKVSTTNFGVPLEKTAEGKYGERVEITDTNKFGAPEIILPKEDKPEMINDEPKKNSGKVKKKQKQVA